MPRYHAGQGDFDGCEPSCTAPPASALHGGIVGMRESWARLVRRCISYFVLLPSTCEHNFKEQSVQYVRLDPIVWNICNIWNNLTFDQVTYSCSTVVLVYPPAKSASIPWSEMRASSYSVPASQDATAARYAGVAVSWALLLATAQRKQYTLARL